jgi:putative endonuclease
MKQFTSRTQRIGEKGEDICTLWLKNNGYSIVERNFSTSRGEIDIIVSKDNKLHFIEVKSVSCENNDAVSHETNHYFNNNRYNPMQNITRDKIVKLQKTMHSYIHTYGVSCETQLDVYAVYIDLGNKNHKIVRIENIF